MDTEYWNRVNGYIRQREAERQREQRRAAVLTGPDAAEMMALEKRADAIQGRRVDMMRVCGEEGRTLDVVCEVPQWDQLTFELHEVRHRIKQLEQRVLMPKP